MRRIAYLFLAAISVLIAAPGSAVAETRPHYGGTLRVMLQSAPDALDLPANAAPIDYWDMARALSLVGDTLVRLDAQNRPQAALAVAWRSDPSARHWQFTLRSGVKFHDGSLVSPGAIAQILGALHPDWNVRAESDSVAIDCEIPMPFLLAELALPRDLLLKRNPNHIPIGTGNFVVAEWQPGKFLRLAANEDSWAGRPFVDAIEIEFGKSLRDQAVALELDKADVIEAAPQAANGGRHSASSSFLSSLPVELLALVFSANSKAQDPHLREALALAIDRKPIQSVLLKGAGEPAGSILPNWMTGYSAVFSAEANPGRARSLLAGSRQAALNPSYVLSYDPRDPQAQLIAERIALNAREAGITLQVSLSGAEDIRLMRVALPSPDSATSLKEAGRELGLPAFPLPDGNSSADHSLIDYSLGNLSLDNLYQAERGLIDRYGVIPLFHLPLAMVVSSRVRAWAPDRLAEWKLSMADLWLSDRPLEDRRLAGPRADSSLQAAPR